MPARDFWRWMWQKTPPSRDEGLAHAQSDALATKLSQGEASLPIIGDRVWEAKSTPEGLLLLKSMRDYFWPPYEPAVGDVDSFGIHAYKSESQFANFDSGGIPSPYPYIYGEVSLWGVVAEHQYGYRAQFAYPKTLRTFGDVSDGELARLGDNYGIQVEHHEEPEAVKRQRTRHEEWMRIETARRQLYFACISRVLSDEEMRQVQAMGFWLVLTSADPHGGGFSFDEQSAKAEYERLLLRQAALREIAKGNFRVCVHSDPLPQSPASRPGTGAARPKLPVGGWVTGTRRT
jgi:hypothetical protein